MAARENQGYLIAVIILVLLSLALALVAFLGVQNAYEQAETAKASEGKLKASLIIAKAGALKGEAYKAMIGDLGPAPSELEKIIQDLKQIANNSTLAEGDKKIVADIVDEVETAKNIYISDTGGAVNNSGDEDASLATLRSRITDLTSLVDRMRKDYTIQVRQTDVAARDASEKIKIAQETLDSTILEMESLKKQLSAAEAKVLTNQAKFQKEIEDFKTAITSVTRESEETVQQKDELIRRAENTVALLEDRNVQLKRRLDEMTKQDYDHADGRVIRVASSLNTVFIDIGSADGLSNNSKFRVYDQSVTNFETASPKGSIEVVQVQSFRSEARITDENPVDPILRGDFILTPTWNPGFSLKIALAGRFDLDGDDHDDTEKLIRLIERNGGVVVARHDNKGNITGKITPDVRYLVEGNEALIGGEEGDANAGRILNALRDLGNDAEKNTVQKISLQKLLNRMGVSAQPKTKQLDFPPGGFVPRSPGSSQGSGSGSATRGSDTR